jgi:hypothetical protein
MKIDDKADQGSFVLVPVGVHPARVVKLERGTTKGNADKAPHEYIRVSFKTLDDSSGFVNDSLHLTDASVKRFKSLYYAVGGGPAFDTDDMTEVNEALMGRTLMLDVKHREYTNSNGELKRVAEPKAWDGFIRMTADEKERWPDGSAATGPEPGESKPTDDDDDSDLPF